MTLSRRHLLKALLTGSAAVVATACGLGPRRLPDLEFTGIDPGVGPDRAVTVWVAKVQEAAQTFSYHLALAAP